MKEIFTSETYADLSRNIEEFMENHDVYDWDNVTIVADKVNDGNDYYWRAVLMPKDRKEAMKDLLCDEHEIIRHFWCKDDIRGLETGGRGFTEEEVDLIAKKMEQAVDCCYGINWDFIDDIAQDVAPDAYVEIAEGGDEEYMDDDNGLKYIESIDPDFQ